MYNETMQAITYSEARNNLAKHLERVVKDCDITIITRQKAEPAVLMSLKEYESLAETKFLLRGKNTDRLLQAVDDVNNQRGVYPRELITE
jgi:antitoxin YefM